MGFSIFLYLFGGVVTEEPACTSQFDYLYKTAQKLGQLENKIEQHSLQDLSHTASARSSKGHAMQEEKDGMKKEAEVIPYVCPLTPPGHVTKMATIIQDRKIYGTDTDVQDTTNIFGNDVNNQDTPCAVCSVQRTVTLMIPGRSNCYSGWKLEYGGYLMSVYHDQPGPHNCVCVVSNPEFVPNSGTNNDQHIFYLVEAKCGSLLCPPFVQDREIDLRILK